MVSSLVDTQKLHLHSLSLEDIVCVLEVQQTWWMYFLSNKIYSKPIFLKSLNLLWLHPCGSLQEQIKWCKNSVGDVIPATLPCFFFSPPGWPPSAACQPQMSWMIIRCARCCLIWSRRTMPSTDSSTPPKASIHRWVHLFEILTIS